jgi:hypothetical protein
MGWWASEDGTGVIGDRPADILGTALTDAFGDRFDVELLAGFLVAVGGALLRNPSELVSDGLEPDTAIAIEFSDLPAVLVPIMRPAVTGALDDAVYDALEAAAFHYRVSELERAPTLAEILETIAFVARGHVTDGGGAPLELDGIRPLGASEPKPAAAFAWISVLALLAGAAPNTPEAEALVAHVLDEADWRPRMTAVLAVGRLRLPALANRARAAEVPALGKGVTDDDRRTLLALREVAAARAEGRALDRPRHPDAEVESRRAALLADVEAAVDGTRLPDSDSPAAVLRTLVNPE